MIPATLRHLPGCARLATTIAGRSYGLAMVALAVIGLGGLAAAAFLPRQAPAT